MPDTAKSKMNTRNARSYTFVFEEVGYKQRWIDYARRVHRMKLPQLIHKLLEEDAATREPAGPPAG